MPVLRVAANPNVKENQGRLAIQRGPLVYCLESADQAAPVSDIILPRDAKLSVEDRKILGGVKVITGEAIQQSDQDWQKTLYAPVTSEKKVKVTAIPYYAWDNRKAGPMAVWIPESPTPRPAGGLSQSAKVTLSYYSGNSSLRGINDGAEIKSSGQQPKDLTHFWPHKGTSEWVEYRWPKAVSLKGSEVYWFDDTGRGECRLPASWALEYLDGETWKPIAANYSIALDTWSRIQFPTLKTTAIRMKLQLKPGWAAGIHEWRVIEDED
jgi:hypothetical protein